MLGLIKFLYPNCSVTGVESIDVVRSFAVPEIPVYPDVGQLPLSIDKYDIVAENLG